MAADNLSLVITKTPFRITFTGGGTDKPEYFLTHGPGAVVSGAIDKYVYVTIGRHFYKDEFRISYSKTENAIKKIEEIEHPTVREALKMFDITGGIQIISTTEIPWKGTGIGSSSSFLVGLLNALHAWSGESVSKKQLAEEAVHIEREVLKESGGWQDQYMAAFGGIQLMEFNKDGSVFLKPTLLDKIGREELQKHLMLFYMGTERNSARIHINQTEEIGRHLEEYKKLYEYAHETYERMGNGNWFKVGNLLDQNWEIKKSLCEGISNDYIDDRYNKAKEAGAIGGKLIGAGEGGFLLIFADPKYHPAIKKALSDLKEEPFVFELDGSRVIHTES